MTDTERRRRISQRAKVIIAAGADELLKMVGLELLDHKNEGEAALPFGLSDQDIQALRKFTRWEFE